MTTIIPVTSNSTPVFGNYILTGIRVNTTEARSGNIKITAKTPVTSSTITYENVIKTKFEKISTQEIIEVPAIADVTDEATKLFLANPASPMIGAGESERTEPKYYNNGILTLKWDDEPNPNIQNPKKTWVLYRLDETNKTHVAIAYMPTGSSIGTTVIPEENLKDGSYSFNLISSSASEITLTKKSGFFNVINNLSYIQKIVASSSETTEDYEETIFDGAYDVSTSPMLDNIPNTLLKNGARIICETIVSTSGLTETRNLTLDLITESI